MNNGKVGYAIYGCGNIANVHAQSLHEISSVELIGAADISCERSRDFAKKYGIGTFQSYDELLDCEAVDVVTICTPSGTHADLAVEALQRGKNVILEKPMALTVEDCDRIIEAVEKSGKKLTVISQLRASEDIKRAKKIIDSGKLGKLTFCEVRMKYYRAPEYYQDSWHGTAKMDGGGALMNQGIHGVDILLYLCGSVNKVQSSVRTIFHDIEVEDTAAAVLEFESGALGVIEATTSVYPGFNRIFEVCGSDGSLIIKEGRIERISTRDGSIHEQNSIGNTENAADATKTDIALHKAQIANFTDIILGDTTLEYCDAYQGKAAVELIKKIYNVSN